MTRPLAFCGFSFYAGILLASLLQGNFVAAAVLCLLSAGAVLVFRKKAWFVPVILVSVSLAFSLYSFWYGYCIKPWMVLENQSAVIRGQLTDYPKKGDNSVSALVKVEELVFPNGEKIAADFSCQVYYQQGLSASPGDYVEGTVTFFRYQQGGLFSVESRNHAKGILLGAFGETEDRVITENPEPPWWTVFPKMRKYLTRCVSRYLPGEEGNLIKAMVLGDREDLSYSTQLDFRMAGVSHLLVISGLHLSALASFLSLALRRLPIGKKGRNLLTALAVFLFLGLIGFPFSAFRSGMMLLFFLGADSFGREGDSLDALGLSLLVISLFNPGCGGDVGLLLSALATAGILLFQPGIYRKMTACFDKKERLHRIWTPIAAGLSVGVAASLGVLPVQLLVFGGISLISPVSSLLLVYPSTLLLGISLLFLFTAAVPFLTPLALPLGILTGLGSRLLIEAAQLFSAIPLPFGAVSSWGGIILCVFYGLLWAALRLEKKRKTMVTVVSIAVALGVTVIACVMEWQNLQGELTLVVSGDDQGVCVVLMEDGEAAVLAAGGYGEGAMLDILKEANIQKVTSVFLSQNTMAERDSVHQVLRKYTPEKIYLPEGIWGGEDFPNPFYYEEDISYEALPGITVQGGEEGLSFQAEGVSITVETGALEGGDCQVLVTGQADSRVNSAFTVLAGDAIIEENRNQIAADQGKRIRLRLADGCLYMRQEAS